MELCTTASSVPTSRTYEICGGTLYSAKDAMYFAMIKCRETENHFKTFDYVFVEDLIHKDVYLAKVHSIYMERKTASLCMELQYFPVLREIQAPGIESAAVEPVEEVVVTEVCQTTALLQVDLATVDLKPICMMYVPTTVPESEVYHHVCTYVESYREEHCMEPPMDVDDEEHGHSDPNQDHDGYEKDSFIASEGTPSVYGSSEGSESCESCKSCESNVEMGEREVTAYFYYNKLDLKRGEELDKPELVPAVDPILLDLLFSYNCDVRDTTGDAYQDLCHYVSKTYFSGVGHETLIATAEPRYMRLKTIVDKAIKEGNGSLIDPYEFFMTLTS